MQVDFRGAEIETPIGGFSLGRGYSHVSGQDYFAGLALRLPVGTFRFGWRAWSTQSEEAEEARRLQVRRRDRASLVSHFLTYIIVMLIMVAFHWALDGLDFIGMVAAIWGAILAFHMLQTLFVGWVVDHIS